MNRKADGTNPTGSWPRMRARWAIGLAFVLCIPVIQVVGQSPFPQQFPSGSTGKAGQRLPDGNTSPFGQEPQRQQLQDQKRLRMLNAERQKQIVSDTDKLLKLARELNDELAKSDSQTMTEAQLRKVNEIGKLARTVKEKMSYSVGAYPGLNPPVNMNSRDPSGVE